MATYLRSTRVRANTSTGLSPVKWRPSADLATLQARSTLLAKLRSYFAQTGAFEVQTPVLGAHAVPDPDVACIEVPGYGFLQPSPEYFLKRLLAAGMPSCYQLGPVFRADEQGRHHRSEFTMLEWYRIGYDHHALMREVQSVVDLVLGPDSYHHCRYADLVDRLDAPRDELDLCFSEAAGQLSGRWFVIDYPADQAALARVLPDQPGFAARFELIVDGLELANGYWELVDVAEHRRRFAEDQEIRLSRGLPQTSEDKSFFAALERGLPDCAGVALGVDRLMMLALGKSDISQVMAFA